VVPHGVLVDARNLVDKAPVATGFLDPLKDLAAQLLHGGEKAYLKAIENALSGGNPAGG